MPESVVIDANYCGPARSGNGGYAAGVLAGFIEGPATITLRLPPPLDRPLDVVRKGDSVTLMDGEAVVAEGKRHVALEMDVPAMPTPSEAEAAVRRYLDLVPDFHVFPNCFVCGPLRAEGQGLRIFSGGVVGRDIVAAPWTPAHNLADDDGFVRSEFLWAALDCPGFFAIWEHTGEPTVAVLGQLTVDIRRHVQAGAPHTVIGWPIERDGRKNFVGTAIYTSDGDIAGLGRGIWVDVPEETWSDLLNAN